MPSYQYFHPKDRSPSDQGFEQEKTPSIEEPIIPMNKLGITVVEQDPRGRFQNPLQSVQAAIRQGAGTLQMVMMTPPTSPIGGRPKAYGVDVRQAMREVLEASKADPLDKDSAPSVVFEGVEMPTVISNLSGFDPQRNKFEDESRARNIAEVKEAIRFVADIAGGGGIDILSQEYDRPIAVAEWNKKIKSSGPNAGAKHEEPLFYGYPEEAENTPMPIVDKRDGSMITQVRRGDVINRPVWKVADEDGWGETREGKKVQLVKGKTYVDYSGKVVDEDNRVPVWIEKEQRFDFKPLKWDDFERIAKDLNEKKASGELKDDHELEWTPEEVRLREQLQSQIETARGWALNYSKGYQQSLDKLKEFQELQGYFSEHEKTMNPEQLNAARRRIAAKAAGLEDEESGRVGVDDKKLPSELLNENITALQRNLREREKMVTGQEQSALQSEEYLKNAISVPKFALNKSISSYAELGIAAMDETIVRKETNSEFKPLFVGPENGWPGGYGSHPTEYIDLIQKSREKMAKELQENRGFSEQQAKDASKEHIKGLFDTSHMGMWLEHYHPRDDKGNEIMNHETRLKMFNKWYMDQIETIAKADVVGSIQAVDSAGAGHGHLPAGQGIFPVVQAVKTFKKHGWDGFVVSEGHEEESFGEGRILTEAWKAFGAHIDTGYGIPSPAPMTWRGAQQGYFGKTYPPTMVFGAYAPSNEWRLWSEVPFE